MNEGQRPVDILFSEAERRNSIRNYVCIKPPFGCNGPARQFRDKLSLMEYNISGLCQICQDKIFGELNPED